MSTMLCDKESFKTLLRCFLNNDHFSFMEAVDNVLRREREAGHTALADELAGILESTPATDQMRDPLTNLLNRACMEKRIATALRAVRENELFALFIIDLDQFKEINDTLGHQAGDKLLTDVGAVLSSIFRASDIVGRLGGDEFMAFLPRIPDEKMVAQKAEELVNALQITTRDLMCISASVGVVIAGNTGKTFSELYDLADQALYEAKHKGKNQYRAIRLTADARYYPRSPVSNTVQLQALLTYMDGAVLLLELDDPFRVLYVSPSYKASLGRDRASCGEEQPLRRIHPPDRESFYAAMREGARTRQAVSHTYRALGENGRILWRHLRAVRIPYAGSGFPVMIIVATDITPLKELETANAVNSERLRIAFEQTSQALWEVDIAERTFAIFDTERQTLRPEQTYQNIPDSLAEKGWVREESREAFIAFMERLLAGRDKDSAAFIILWPFSTDYVWAKLSYHMLRGSDGQPQKAVGIAQQLPAIEYEQACFLQEERLFKMLCGSVRTLVVANLTTDAISTLCLVAPFQELTFERYSDFFDWHLSTLCDEEDVRVCKDFFSLAALRDTHAAGTNWLMKDYRHREAGGADQWLSTAAHLLINPVTRDLYAFCCTRHADARRHWEGGLTGRLDRDAITHLYTQNTGVSIIRQLLGRQGDAAHCCSLALVDVNGGAALEESVGYNAAARILLSIGRLFRILLDGESVVTRYTDSRLLIFWPECPSDQWAERRLSEIVGTVQRVREPVGQRDGIVFVGGIATAHGDQAGYDELYTQAAYICEQLRDAPSDTTLSFDSYLEKKRAVSDTTGEQSVHSIASSEDARPLSAVEKDALLSALTAMLSARDYDMSVNCMLRTLGGFYDADRVYTLGLNRDQLSIRYEWCAPGKCRLFPHMKPTPLAKMPIIVKCLAERRPMLFGADRAAPRFSLPRKGEDRAQNTAWRYIAAPFLDDDEPIGVLCVENARVHYTDTALLSRLAALAVNERVRYRMMRKRALSEKCDPLTGLPDQAMYLEMLHALAHEALDSLGVLYLSVNDMHSINRQFGFKHGDALLLFAASSLEDVFTQSECFRLYGDVFAVLCRNMSSESFTQKYIRLQSVLDRRQPGRFCLGYAWSDKKDATAQLLADEAESMMIHRKRSLVMGDAGDVSRQAETLLSLRTDIGVGSYCIYLQPIIDLQTGGVVGAEALSRYLHPHQGVMVPAAYIAQFEQLGIIRELDLHNLELALQLQEKWQVEGRPPLRVTVNFSRQSIDDPTTFAAVLAIHSRYDVPAKKIGIEVTESLGCMERKIFTSTIRSLQENGFSIALDDFGTAYANLSILSSVPFDIIKLDQSLVRDLAENNVNRSILESTVRICEQTNARCVAEGVETLDLCNILREAGCRYAQGYYFDKPIPPDAFEQKYLQGADEKQDRGETHGAG